jgi:hypothetical protein
MEIIDYKSLTPLGVESAGLSTCSLPPAREAAG